VRLAIKKPKAGKWQLDEQKLVHCREIEGKISLSSTTNVTVGQLKKALEQFDDDFKFWLDGSDDGEDTIVLYKSEVKPCTDEEIAKLKKERKEHAIREAQAAETYRQNRIKMFQRILGEDVLELLKTDGQDINDLGVLEGVYRMVAPVEASSNGQRPYI